jgi:aspartate beta-hydroxylase
LSGLIRSEQAKAGEMSASKASPDVTAAGGARVIDDDSTAAAIVDLLRSEGAAGLRHARGSTLLDHLTETYCIVRRWKQPVWLQHAALIHSAYGTDVYHQQLLPPSRREDVLSVVGPRAERLAYLFSVTARDPLLAGTHLWAREMPARATGGERAVAEDAAPTRDELDALVLLHMANLAEQAQAKDGSPGRWLARLRELAELLIDSDAVTPPLFVAELAAFSEEDESLSRRAYLAGISSADDVEAGASRLGLAAAVCPVVPEPCVWQAHLSQRRGDLTAAKWWAGCARERLLELGTVWDKRLTFAEWLQLAEPLEQPRRRSAAAEAIRDPRALYDATIRDRVRAGSRVSMPPLTPEPTTPPDPDTARKRFRRYIEMLAEGNGATPGAIYPDLPSQPWHDPQHFPLARYLEAHYTAIRDEIVALESSRFHRESEGIQRSGDWDVAFLYERGRRRDEVCDACPVTTRGIESYSAMRTIAGLIYVSRMRGSTHIRAHHGPTNLRVRCHLAIKVPAGDCAIRVGDETRHWQEGKCLVFDDYFEHEAWNRTEEDRIVLIVDMWHPGLSATDVSLLEGLHNYAFVHARKLSRYWSANAAAARKASSE